jgi:AcrR family transcriptional regulator
MKAESGRERIVEAALRLFTQRGFAASSIADVAEEAGVLKGNLAYYFRTKAELLEAAAQALSEAYMARITHDLPSDASADECLERFLRTIEDAAPELAESGCPIGSLCTELGRSEPALQVHASSVLRGVQDWLTTQLERLLTQPAHGAACAEQLLSQLQGASLLSHAYRDPALLQRQVGLVRHWLSEQQRVSGPPRAKPGQGGRPR